MLLSSPHRSKSLVHMYPVLLGPVLSYATALPNILPPPHDSLLNFIRQLRIKNDYREIKIGQSFAGKNHIFLIYLHATLNNSLLLN